jgi:hypothetical protein
MESSPPPPSSSPSLKDQLMIQAVETRKLLQVAVKEKQQLIQFDTEDELQNEALLRRLISYSELLSYLTIRRKADKRAFKDAKEDLEKNSKGTKRGQPSRAKLTAQQIKEKQEFIQSYKDSELWVIESGTTVYENVYNNTTQSLLLCLVASSNPEEWQTEMGVRCSQKFEQVKMEVHDEWVNAGIVIDRKIIEENKLPRSFLDQFRPSHLSAAATEKDITQPIVPVEITPSEVIV